MESKLRLFYFGINAPTKSARDSVYIEALKESGVRILECVDSSPSIKKYLQLIRKHREVRGQYDVIFVGHMSALVVPLARMLSSKPIIFNALNPLYDGIVLERKIHSPFSLGAIGIWLVDVLSLNCSHKVLLETNVQIDSVHKKFWVPLRKLVRLWTTVDPEVYKIDSTVPKSSRFMCIFRGFLTHVTGAEYVVEAAELLKKEDVVFRFIVRGDFLPVVQKMIQEKGLTNIELCTEFYSFEELRKLISAGHIYLGQFSDHERLERTIQFKTIEALSFGLPYITSDLPSNRELLHGGVDALLVPRANSQAIADAIVKLKNDPALQKSMGEAAQALYKKELEPSVLANQIVSIARSLEGKV